MTGRELLRLAAALLILPAVEGMLSVSHQRVPLVPLLAVSLFAGLLWVLLDRARTLAWRPDRLRHRNLRPHTHEPFIAVESLERRLRQTSTRALVYDLDVRPRLRRLVEARLADRHGIAIADHPERAREIMGERLWGMLSGTDPRGSQADGPGPSLEELEELVTAVEKL